MKRLYLGILVFTSFLYVRTSRVKRFSYNDQRGDWNWNRSDQFTDAQTKTTSQANWPTKGSGGSTKGRGDTSTSRDGAWTPDSWSSTDNIGNDGYDMGWNTEPQGNSKGSAYPEEDGGQGGSLDTILGGVPGMDFPNFVAVPSTSFDCSLMPSRGYYGDVEAGCQVFHICQPGNRKDSFLCPVGTIFNQKYFVCDWWFNVNCSDTPSYYDLNNEVYKEATPPATTEVAVTTEKTPLPWTSQDLDKKRPTKSWGNQPSTGKQNTRRKDTPSRRGSKSSDPVLSTTRDVSNSWGRSDVQKEITVSWGSSSGTTTGSFGSSSTSSSSFIPTTNPIWYGIDGQPAKDQSNGMSKRTGLAQTPAPFGTRMRKGTAASAANAWTSTEVYETTTAPPRGSSYGTSTTNVWQKSSDFYDRPTTGGWLKDDRVTDAPKSGNGNKWDRGVSGHHATLKREDIPETSINPSGIKGVWDLETTKRSDQTGQTDALTVGHKGFVTKSNQPGTAAGRKFRAVSKQTKEWGQRQTFRNRQSTKVSNGEWVKNNFQSLNINDIPRRKSWK